MIDTKELRNDAKTAHCGHMPLEVSGSEMLELLDRLEAAESTRRDDYQNWMTALDRNAELLAKLGAAEKERNDFAQQLVQSEIGKREISEARDGLQAEVGKLKDIEVARCVKINGYIVDNARLVEEVERLRAKIERMEQQEPVAWMSSRNGFICKENKNPDYNVPLYALPGAKGEEE